MRVCKRVRKEKLLPVGAGVNKRFVYDGMVYYTYSLFGAEKDPRGGNRVQSLLLTAGVDYRMNQQLEIPAEAYRMHWKFLMLSVSLNLSQHRSV